MKRNILILLTLVTAGAFSSCNDQMDLPIDGRIPYEGIWKDRNRTMGYLNSCYAYTPSNNFLDIAAFTDEAHSVSDVEANTWFSYWYAGSVGAKLWPTSMGYLGTDWWSKWYQGIRYCNVFIAELPGATAYGQPDEKAGWMAQAKCLRAFYYLSLIRNFGPCPLITEAYSFDHDFAKDRRAPVWEIVQQILKDTDEALAAPGSNMDATLGFRWVINTDNANAMHRALAYMIRSEAILYAVSPLFAGEEGNPYTWDDATRITKEALDQCLTHDYKLFDRLPDDPGDAMGSYDYYFLTKYDWNRPLDKETIYNYAGMSIWNYYGLPSSKGQTSAGICPTQELVDCYESVETDNEGNITKSYPVLDLQNPYNDEDHLVPNYNNENPVYNPADPYANRDPRFYASIYYNGAPRYLTNPDEYRVEIYDGGKDEIDMTLKQNTRTGYYLRKYNHNKSNVDNALDGGMRMFRLAQLYLNFAEAANESSPSPNIAIDPGAPGGTMMSALDAVNAVRARVGMPGVSDAESSSQAIFREKIRNERRIELAFEGVRYYDIRRWKILDETERVVTGMRATQEGEDFSYERFVVGSRNTDDNKFLLQPLPVSEVTVMYKHTGVNWQNPGYEGVD